MRKLALLCLVSLLATPVVAAGHAQRSSLILPEIVTSPVVKPIEDAAFVARVMAQALEHRSRTRDGRVDINAIDDVRSARRLVIPVDGLSRIYTKQPGSNGTVSQEFPTVDADYFSAQNSAASLGLRQDAGFRTNYGIVNIDSAPHAFHVRFVGERLTTEANLTVPAY